jgi:pimeloyl-ACP methyl ester carboxylesterase
MQPPHASHSPDPQSRRVEIDGFAIHYWEWLPAQGDAAADLVVLLHGFLDHGYTFAPMVAAARARFTARLVAPDFRGHGRSGRVGPGGYYYFPDYIGDTWRLIERIPHRRLAVVGHSMGGSVAWMLGGAWPARVSAMVLMEGLGPPDFPSEDSAALLRQWVESVDRVRAHPPRSMATVEDAATRLRQANPLLPESIALDLARTGTERAIDGGLIWAFDPLHRTPSPLPFSLRRARAFWSAITCPVLHVLGSESQFRLPDADERLACFRHLRQVEVPQAGHMMHHDQPAATAQLIADHIDACWRAP